MESEAVLSSGNEAVSPVLQVAGGISSACRVTSLRADQIRGRVVDQSGLEHFLSLPLENVLITSHQRPCDFLPYCRGCRSSEVHAGKIKSQRLCRAADHLNSRLAKRVSN